MFADGTSTLIGSNASSNAETEYLTGCGNFIGFACSWKTLTSNISTLNVKYLNGCGMYIDSDLQSYTFSSSISSFTYTLNQGSLTTTQFATLALYQKTSCFTETLT